METIKNYLDNMFANLPRTDEVLKAKNELSQMMEDKYNELIEEGKSENEAVGIVISEFGNLNEIADDLGINETVKQVNENPVYANARKLTPVDAKQYLKDNNKASFLRAFGVFLCIIAFIPVMVVSALVDANYLEDWIEDVVGVSTIFPIVFIAVILFSISKSIMKKWKFINNELCVLDYQTASQIKFDMDSNSKVYAVIRAVGIVFCAICWFPAAVLSEIDFDNDLRVFTEEIASPVALFSLIAVGVLLIIVANGVMRGYKNLTKASDGNTMVGSYVNEGVKVYKNQKIEEIMKLFWPTVTCIYLIESFLTFDWGTSWLIWPIAGVIKYLIDTATMETKKF
ncbi:permease prefix domain 1-containing protein [Eubacterium sp.]|uniref:permease prefix domain 1-containing protein n=1 Tax=Eubacterium sp. TaxID=142586 RepID=UPI0025FD5D36|nr:permease prefix domain 1-containing protein [Eubacterium sp.]MCR5629548.1 permease prefix domain 1-containing protein [Eubacterium sp.]